MLDNSLVNSRSSYVVPERKRPLRKRVCPYSVIEFMVNGRRRKKGGCASLFELICFSCIWPKRSKLKEMSTCAGWIVPNGLQRAKQMKKTEPGFAECLGDSARHLGPQRNLPGKIIATNIMDKRAGKRLNKKDCPQSGSAKAETPVVAIKCGTPKFWT